MVLIRIMLLILDLLTSSSFLAFCIYGSLTFPIFEGGFSLLVGGHRMKVLKNLTAAP